LPKKIIAVKVDSPHRRPKITQKKAGKKKVEN